MSMLVGNYCKYITFGDVIFLTLLVVTTQALLLNGAMILSPFTLIKLKPQMKSMLNSRKIYGAC